MYRALYITSITNHSDVTQKLVDSSYRHTCFVVFMMDIEGIVVPMFGSINAGVQVPQSIV